MARSACLLTYLLFYLRLAMCSVHQFHRATVFNVLCTSPCVTLYIESMSCGDCVTTKFNLYRSLVMVITNIISLKPVQCIVATRREMTSLCYSTGPLDTVKLLRNRRFIVAFQLSVSKLLQLLLLHSSYLCCVTDFEGGGELLYSFTEKEDGLKIQNTCNKSGP